MKQRSSETQTESDSDVSELGCLVELGGNPLVRDLVEFMVLGLQIFCLFKREAIFFD